MNLEAATQTPTEPQKADKSQGAAPKGGRNLLLLGIIATSIAFLTTFISLKIYHDSGDIYLDRSRPGFLPEKEEVEKDEDSDSFVFSDSGLLTPEVLEEYLGSLKQEINHLDDFSSDPFSTLPLSDSILGF